MTTPASIGRGGWRWCRRRSLVLDVGVPTYTKDDIVALAGPRSYDRGVDYIDNVSGLVAGDISVTAAVVGTGRYEVQLDISEGLAGECDCPYGEEGNFCKHCVAVALVYLYHAERGTLVLIAGQPPPALPDYLAGLSHDTLVELLLTAAAENPDLRKRLELRAATDAGQPADIEHIRSQIDNLLYIGDYVHYREASDYASRVEEVAGRLTDLAQAGHGEVVVELTRHALATVAESYTSVDDSSGYVGAVLEELAAVHAEVCAEVRPDPDELAGWLLGFRSAGHDWPELSLAEYAEALGEEGMARYGEGLAARWRDSPGDDKNYRHFQLSRLMEEWATECGDVDLLVRILSDPRPHGIQYRRIAEVLTGASQHHAALEWAERGLADPNARVDDSLVDFVVTRYTEAGRRADVLTVRRARFASVRSLSTYQQLRDAALVEDSWPATRQWALDLLHPSEAARGRPWEVSGSVLVDILLWEEAVDEAWAAARRYGANAAQWLRLARAREATHADDAIAVYQRQLDRHVEQRQKDAYRQAAELAARVGWLYESLDQGERFAVYLAGLRKVHKSKRNFMAALDHCGL